MNSAPRRTTRCHHPIAFCDAHSAAEPAELVSLYTIAEASPGLLRRSKTFQSLDLDENDDAAFSETTSAWGPAVTPAADNLS